MEAAVTNWLEYYDAWHEFYLMAGTAAVTLAGLLFVAISLHIDALVHEHREHLLLLARNILFSYIMVLVLSLMLLIPHQRLQPTAVELIVLGLVFLRISISLMRWKPKVEHAGFTTKLMRRRLLFPMAGYTIVLLTGVGLLITGVPEMMGFAVGGVCMLLGNAAGASWDLLVRVAKIKKDAEAAQGPGSQKQPAP